MLFSLCSSLRSSIRPSYNDGGMKRDWIDFAARVENIVTPLFAFLGVYLLVLYVWLKVVPLRSVSSAQWSSLLAALTASFACWVILEKRGRSVAVVVPLREILRSFLDGALTAAAVLFSADLLIRFTTSVDFDLHSAIPWSEVTLVLVPAVVHEELLLRGYLFQKVARSRPFTAVALSSLVFAALHVNNEAVSLLALANITIGGVLLGLAFLLRANLWFPIAIHFFWNFISGPLLGHEVSGYAVESTLLRVDDQGPALLTGGGFGIEASLFMTLAELAAVAVLAWRLARRHSRSSRSVRGGDTIAPRLSS